MRRTHRFFVCFVLFLQFFCFSFSKDSKELNTGLKKFIYSPQEYTAYIDYILQNKLKRFQNLYNTKIEVYYELNKTSYKFLIDLREPIYKPTDRMKELFEDFKRENKWKKSSYNLYLSILRDYFFSAPKEIEYNTMLTLDAKNVDKIRLGNCFALTNYFVAVTRLLV